MKRIHLILLSVVSGVLFALAWPERGFNPLAFIALVPLFFIQQYLGDNQKKGMFWYAWLSFFIWNVLTTWWIWHSTDIGSILAISLNSLFIALVFFLFHLSKKKLYQNKKGFFILVFYWVSWEFFHMNWDLTWSWLNVGNVFASSIKWVQWYEYTGTLGGTVWVLVGNIVAYHVARSLIVDINKKAAITNGIILILLIGLPIGFSYFIYNNYEEIDDPVEVVVVQPNTDPYTEAYNMDPEVLLMNNFELAARKITDNTKFVVFPESTLYDGRYSIWEDNLWGSPLLKKVKTIFDDYPQVSIVIGASTARLIEDGEKKTNAARKFTNSEGYYYSYNTAFLFDSTQQIQTHHKSKLTPGVERMPSWGILKPIEYLAIDLGGTTGTLGTEDHPVVFHGNDGTIISPIICYESVYGEFVINTIREGAELIFVITNDGWWGNTPGHRQHFLFSGLRAIETRRSIARSANTGISAFINQRGEVFQKTKYWEPAVIRQEINANDKLTYYVKNGDYIARVSVFISALLLIISFSQGFLRKQKKLS